MSLPMLIQLLLIKNTVQFLKSDILAEEICRVTVIQEVPFVWWLRQIGVLNKNIRNSFITNLMLVLSYTRHYAQ